MDDAAEKTIVPESREHRRRVIKGASILNGVNRNSMSCLVRNQHEHGAELKVGQDIPVPREFLLWIPVDGVAYLCTLRWRRADRAGVSFRGAEPKPRWFY